MTLADVQQLAGEYHDRTIDEFIAIVKAEYLKREWEWLEPKFNQLLDEVMSRRQRFFEAIEQQGGGRAA